jgi:L-ascorbate metabolism protein UlaG (beta-lactamase superfamily)
VVAGDEHRIYHSGDTGYFDGFKEIGAAHGPFDATMIQIGAYSEFWPDIHMTPEEGMRAHLDLQGGQPHGVLLPIHWGTFNLAMHPWAEPGEWTVDEGEAAGQAVATPTPGEPFEPGGELTTGPWWRPFGGTIAHPWRTPKPVETEPKPTTAPVELDLANER